METTLDALTGSRFRFRWSESSVCLGCRPRPRSAPGTWKVGTCFLDEYGSGPVQTPRGLLGGPSTCPRPVRRARLPSAAGACAALTAFPRGPQTAWLRPGRGLPARAPGISPQERKAGRGRGGVGAGGDALRRPAQQFPLHSTAGWPWGEGRDPPQAGAGAGDRLRPVLTGDAGVFWFPVSATTV